MEYPIFDIPYKDAYSSSIEFNTQINEKVKGREQRYPIWTYPKRVFTLKFDKNFNGRKNLEDFFISVQGQAKKFKFVWDESKGGNGKTYLCYFDSDSFAQNIDEFGFSDCELKLVCIDDSKVENVDKLDFYHKAKCESTISFYTIVDKIFTAQGNRKAYWDSPRKSWTLSFEKNAVNRRKLEEFFIAKRGRFRSFEWTWDKSLGGDGKTYTVRFDEDTLLSNIDAFGFGEIEIKIKEVFSNQNPSSEIEKDEIIGEHTSPVDGAIYVLDGKIEIHFEAEKFTLEKGEILMFKKDATHKVLALKDSKFFLVKI